MVEIKELEFENIFPLIFIKKKTKKIIGLKIVKV